MDHDDDDYFSNPAASDASSEADTNDDDMLDSDEEAEDLVNIEQLKSELDVDGEQEGGAPIGTNERVVEPLDENMQRFSNELRRNHILTAHPECIAHSDDELLALLHIVRNDNGRIIDDFHRTIPFLTKYERARVIGARAEQLNAKAVPLVPVPDHIIDGVVIATMELEAKKMPFIIKRPLPNGTFEYWHVHDLEML
jgi:DNA-directed RNA polymerase I, II, and III subunit RPABC2